ncbi:PpiC-type peptidyl-prolyl cis-trans isomerase [Candidatus Omnitrophus magneticus]|uniref:PpiC-type peptidyl-prolyl cis-trans isomerase n=1 Tax=Candidatus Omnitrophus magneticus TaxID=1609969 RepID=A0A0F0CM26_9BACT|nr:PpiC-type peptidyl-prolyl cis-trans isomerase [Candidatus Omnitrophus magneticus]
MLHILRSKKFAKRTFLILAILIIPAFVLWGTASFDEQKQLIGTVGNKKIFSNDFVKSLEATKVHLLFNYYGNSKVFNEMTANREMMNRMAWERCVLLAGVEKQGIKVSDEELVSFISKHPLFARNGVFDKGFYEMIVTKTLYMETRKFEELVRENLKIQKFIEKLYTGVNVADEDVLNYFKRKNDKIDISYIVFDKVNFTVQPPSPEIVRNYYNEHKKFFQSPMKVEIEYIDMPFKTAEEKEALRVKAEEIYNQIVTAAKTDSIELIANGHSLHYNPSVFVEPNMLIPGIKFSEEFYKIIFSMPEGGITKPILIGEKEGMIVIAKKKSIVPSQIEPFENVEKKIAEEFENQAKTKAAMGKADGVYQSILKGEITFEKAGELNGVTIMTLAGIQESGYIENVGPAKVLVDKALREGARNVLPPLAIPKGAAIVRVDKIIAADIAGLPSQKENITRELLEIKKQNVLMNWFSQNMANTEIKKSLSEL